jgi:hypothetical protein
MDRQYLHDHALALLQARGETTVLDAVDRAVETVAHGGSASLDFRGNAGLGATQICAQARRTAARLGVPCVTFAVSSPAIGHTRGMVASELLARLVELDAGVGAIEGTLWADPDVGLELAVQRFVQRQPLVLAVDDLHLASTSLQRTLQRLSQPTIAGSGRGLGVVVTSAPDDAPGALVGSPADIHELRPLTSEQMDLVIDEWIETIDEQGREAIKNQARGNVHWLTVILEYLISADVSVAEISAAVDTFTAAGWDRAILAAVSTYGAIALKALSVLNEVAPIPEADFANVVSLTASRLAKAKREMSRFVRVDEHGLQIEHELTRRALANDATSLERMLWIGQAAQTVADPLLRAFFVRALEPGVIKDEVEILRAGAAHCTDDERFDLLSCAFSRAHGDEAHDLALELAHICLRVRDEPSAAIQWLQGRRPEPSDRWRFARWTALWTRALARAPAPQWVEIRRELRRAAEVLAGIDDAAWRLILMERAGKVWLSEADLIDVMRQLEDLQLLDRDGDRPDARMLLAAAQHVAVLGGPGKGHRPEIKRPSVHELVRRALEGEGLFTAESPSDHDRLCEAQWLLLCCDAYDEAAALEERVAEIADQLLPSTRALHEALIAQRLLIIGDLEGTVSRAKGALVNIARRRRGLALGVLVDALVEQGEIGRADDILAAEPPPESGVDEWRLVLARARVDRNLLRFPQAVERLVEVGLRHEHERRRSAAFSWRIDLIRLLTRFRFPQNPQAQQWYEALALLLPGVPAEEMVLRLAHDEHEHATRWSTPVALARSLRAMAEALAASDPMGARERRERAVALLSGDELGECGPAELEFYISLYELTRQDFELARTERDVGAADGDAVVPAQALEFSRNVLEWAWERGAAQLWLRTWDVTSTYSRQRRVGPDGPMESMLDTGERIPYITPTQARWAELGAIGFTQAKLKDLFGPRNARHNAEAVRVVLDELRPGGAPSRGRTSRRVDAVTGGRLDDWVALRNLQFARFHDRRTRQPRLSAKSQ